MAASFKVYIDESGDEGFVFDKGPGRGSSRWFVLSAVITRSATDIETVKLVDGVRSTLGKPARAPLHFRRLKHEHRIPLVTAIAQARLRVVTVLVHKPSLQEPEKFQERYVLYRFATRYLLERVSWFCRDHRLSSDPGDGTANVVFSNRAGMSYEELRTYLDLLKARTGLFDVRIDWDVIKPRQVRAFAHAKLMGLQIADAVASGFYFGIQTNPYGFTEPRYAELLKPVVYHRKAQYLGYGLKFWPREAESMRNTQEGLQWIGRTYT